MHPRTAFDLWLVAIQAEGRSRNTVEGHKGHLTPFTRWLEEQGITDVNDLTPFYLRRFPNEYAQDHSPQMVKSVYANMRVWLRWLVSEGILHDTPTDRVKTPSAPETSKKVYSPGELHSILKYLERDRTALTLREYALVSILADTGARASETLSLTIDDIQEDCLLLRQTKGRRPRMIPLGSKAQKALWTYMQRGRPRLKPGDKTVFITPDGRPVTRNALRCILNRVGEALGFPVSAHRFRHTWTTMMLRKGVDLETLRRIGGWQD